MHAPLSRNLYMVDKVQGLQAVYMCIYRGIISCSGAYVSRLRDPWINYWFPVRCRWILISAVHCWVNRRAGVCPIKSPLSRIRCPRQQPLSSPLALSPSRAQACRRSSSCRICRRSSSCRQSSSCRICRRSCSSSSTVVVPDLFFHGRRSRSLLPLPPVFFHGSSSAAQELLPLPPSASTEI